MRQRTVKGAVHSQEVGMAGISDLSKVLPGPCIGSP